MSSDLEKFLQQAAERLAQKAASRPDARTGDRGRTGNASGAGQRRPSGQVPAEPPRAAMRPQPPMAEIIPAEVVDRSPNRLGNLREAGPDPLSNIDTRPPLAQDISLADERMLDHVHQTFDHELTNLRAASSSLAGTGRSSSPEASHAAQVAAALAATPPIVSMLRNPTSLRVAFIASEIFKRKT